MVKNIKIRDFTIPIKIEINLRQCLFEVIDYILKSELDFIPVKDDNDILKGFISKNTSLKCLNLESSCIRVLDILIKEFEYLRDDQDIICGFNMEYNEIAVLDEYGNFIGVFVKSRALLYCIKYLNQSVKGLNEILESVTNGIMAVDSDNKIIFYNTAAQEIIGVKKEYAISNDVTKVFESSFLPFVNKTGQKDIGRIIDINGKTVMTNRTPILEGGKVVGAVAIFQDITDYKSIVRELDREKNATFLLNAIIETLYDGILVIDKDGYITLISKVYAKFLGVDYESSIGKHVTEVIENTRMHLVAKTGQPEIADIQMINGNPMIATRIPVIKDGEIIGVVGKVLFRNIDELNALYKKISLMEKEIQHYKYVLSKSNTAKYNFDSIKGNSNALNEVKNFAKKAGITDFNVLILGESGTGKELFAHAIHNFSNRSHAPFIKVNCAAIPNELLESELFGYEGGAFTGANKQGKIGKFLAANGGTIFLDEVGDMPLPMQAKLLRVLQEKEIERIGSNKSEKIDVRIIAATNKRLDKLVLNGSFRSDLYYRLNVLTINIPPLRDRKEDIPNISNCIIERLCSNMYKNSITISGKAMELLMNYSWPGNVRELENIIERALSVIGNEEIITDEHLPPFLLSNIKTKSIQSLEDILKKAEKQAIIDSLMICSGNKSKASKLLKISRSSLYEKIEKYKIKY